MVEPDRIPLAFLQVYRDERKVQKLMHRTLGNPNPAHGPGCQTGATNGTVSGGPRIERTSVSLVSAEPLGNGSAGAVPGEEHASIACKCLHCLDFQYFRYRKAEIRAGRRAIGWLLQRMCALNVLWQLSWHAVHAWQCISSACEAYLSWQCMRMNNVCFSALTGSCMRAGIIHVIRQVIRHGDASAGVAGNGDHHTSRSEVERIQRLQDEVFNRGCIPWWIAAVGYVAFALLAIIVIPFLYTPVKWCAQPRATLTDPLPCIHCLYLLTTEWDTALRMSMVCSGKVPGIIFVQNQENANSG